MAPGCFLCSYRGHKEPQPVAELNSDQSAALVAQALLHHVPLPQWLRRLVDGRPGSTSRPGGDSFDGDAADHNRRRLSYVDVYEEQFTTTSVCVDGTGNEDCLAYLSRSAVKALVPGPVARAAALLVLVVAWVL